MSVLSTPEETWKWHICGQGWNCNSNTTAHLWLRKWNVCKVNGSSVSRSSNWSPSSVNDCLWWNESCRKGWNQCWLSLSSICCCLGDQRRPTNVKHKRWRPTKRARPELWFYCKHGWIKSTEDLHPLWERKLKVHIYIYLYMLPISYDRS